MKIDFINLTPHAITVLDVAGVRHVFPANGVVARVAAQVEDMAPIEGFRRRRQTFGAVEGLPAPVPGVIYIVSALVKSQVPERDDVVAPDTGPDAVRENGQIQAVRGFV